jgi:hypothetical protein
MVIHLDLRREGKLLFPQMVLELFQERDDILFQRFLAVLDIRRSFSGMVGRDARLSVLSTAATAIFAVNFSASSWAFMYLFLATENG